MSFFTASGKKPFTRRILIATIPVSKIDLAALEVSAIVLEPFNPEFTPLVATAEEDAEFRVVAEVVAALP